MHQRYYTVLLILALLTIKYHTSAQDSLNTLNSAQLISIVKQYHPVLKQANLAILQSSAEITIARAAFDPLLQHSSGRKTFDGTNYYNYGNTQLTIPTWYGVEVTTGIETLNGSRLDPTQTVGNNSYFGISVPLAKDLVIDKRRAYLQQAKIINQLEQVQRRAIVNDILMEAIDAYWQWVNAYNTYVVIKNAVKVNEQRLELVRKTYQFGERPAIDTTEALAQLQSFEYEQNQYWLTFLNAGLALNAYLWQANGTPYSLPTTVVPITTWEAETPINTLNLSITDLLQVAQASHPQLQVYNYKLDYLTVDRQLKFQELLPKINFNYNQLGKGYNILKTTTTGPLFQNNFQYGIKLEVPLRLSQGRGAYKVAQLKLQQTNLDLALKRQQIELKIKSYYNEMITYVKQIQLQTLNYNNNQRLVKAEEQRFFNGESSLFLINSRENKTLEALEKLIALKTKYYKTLYALQWSAGLLQ